MQLPVMADILVGEPVLKSRLPIKDIGTLAPI